MKRATCYIYLLLFALTATVHAGYDDGDNIPADRVAVDTTSFDGNLSLLDDTVQNALETLDNAISGGSGSSQWLTGSSCIYYNVGNVGIGTSSPAQKLAVSGNAIVAGDITGTGNIHLKSAGEKSIILQSTAHYPCGITFLRDGAIYTDWRMKDDSGYLQWQYSPDDGATWTNAMQIAGDSLAFECFKDVRIEGDLSTNAHLSATGSLYYALLDVNGKLKGRSAIKYPGLGTGTGGGTWGSITGTLSAQTDLQNALDAKLNTDGTLTGVIHSLVTDHNSYLSSNLGIGTTTPEREFDVVGDAKFSGDLSSLTGTFGSVTVYGTQTANAVYAGYMKALTLDAYGDYLIVDKGMYIDDDTTVTGSVATFSGPIKITSDLRPSYVVNGNFGIGTTAPTAQLHVTGSAKFGSIEITAGSVNINELTPIGSTIVIHGDTYTSGDATVVGTLAVGNLETSASDMELGGDLSADSVLAADLTINKLVSPSGTVYFATVDSAGKFGKSALAYPHADGAGSGGSSYKLDASDGSPANVVYCDAAGNVGVGTTTPAAKLEVVGESYFHGGTLYADILNGHMASSIQLGTGNFSLTTTNGGNLSILPAGNVGIGTIAPSAKLGVKGDLSVTNNIFVTGNVGIGRSDLISAYGLSTNGAAIIMDYCYSTGFRFNANYGTGIASGGNDIRFQTGNEFGEAARITSTGNVGIGTTAPTRKLDVAGDMNVSTDATIGNNLSANGTIYGEEHAFQLFVDGTLSTDTTAGGVLYNDTGSSLKILGAKASVVTAPTGAAIQVGVNLNGANITTTPITVNAGTYVDAGTTAFNDVTVAPNEKISFNLSKVGSTVAGGDLWVKVRCKKVR